MGRVGHPQRNDESSWAGSDNLGSSSG